MVRDFDRDGNLDIVISGNFYGIEFRTARNDAGVGLFLRGNGEGDFTSVPVHESGYFTPGDVKDLATIKYAGEEAILVANNNDLLQLIKVVNADRR